MRGVIIDCGVFGEGHELIDRGSTRSGQDDPLVEVRDLRASGSTGVLVLTSDGERLLHHHDNVGLIATFRARTGSALMARHLLRIPDGERIIEVSLAEQLQAPVK